MNTLFYLHFLHAYISHNLILTDIRYMLYKYKTSQAEKRPTTREKVTCKGSRNKNPPLLARLLRGGGG